MNKAQLIEELSSRFEGNKKQAQHALESVIDVIQRTLVTGEKVAITGFGAFEKIDRPARTARNPKTGASVKVKKTSVPKFRPGSDLKAVVSGAKKLPKIGAAKKAATAAGGTRKTAAANGGETAAKRTTKAAEKTTAKAAEKTTAKTTTRSTAKAASGTGTRSTAKKASAGTAAKKTTSAAKKTASRSTAKKTASR